MKAEALEQILQCFDPKALSNEVELRQWYVPRSGSPRRRLRILLEKKTGPQKVLFVGHRGTGKTTELNKLAEELHDSFETIGFDILEITGRTTPEYEDLMLAVATQVTKYCIEKKLIFRPLSESLRQGEQRLLDWWRRLVAGQDFGPAAEESLGVKLKTVLGQIELGVKQSSHTRDEIKQQLNQRMPELVRHLNWVIEEAERDRPRKLLLVVEGLDKVDLEAARNIFRDHAPTIAAPQATMIFTFPLALRHSDDFDTIRRNFPAAYFLPNIAVRHADGSEDHEGLEILRRMVMARAVPDLIRPEALRGLLEANGGIPVWLMTLVHNAALYALEGGSEQISADHVQSAVRDLRRDTLAPLKRQDYKVLRERNQDHRLTNDPEEQRLLFNGSLIEYSNDVPWCAAHPVLWPLLEREAEGAPEDGE